MSGAGELSEEIEWQRTYRVAILCASAVLAWAIWCIRGCAHDQSDRAMVEAQSGGKAAVND